MNPEAGCIALVREAVDWWRAHREAMALPPEQRGRLPELDLRSWYARADAAVSALPETET